MLLHLESTTASKRVRLTQDKVSYPTNTRLTRMTESVPEFVVERGGEQVLAGERGEEG